MILFQSTEFKSDYLSQQNYSIHLTIPIKYFIFKLQTPNFKLYNQNRKNKKDKDKTTKVTKESQKLSLQLNTR